MADLTDNDDLRERVARALAEVDGITICSDASYRHSSYGIRADAALSATPIEALQQRVERLTEALTPSGDTKAAYMGEFAFNVMVDSIDEDDDEPVPMQVYVPWTTIKEIMAAISARAVLGDDVG